MRVHMPHVHVPHVEDKQLRHLGRSLVALAIVALVMGTLATIFLHGAPPPPPPASFLR
jgi:hypothetical protein